MILSIFFESPRMPSISSISRDRASVSSVRFKIYSRLICRSFISATYSACTSSIPNPTIRLGTTSVSSSVSLIS